MHFWPSYTLMYMYGRIFSRYKRRRRLWGKMFFGQTTILSEILSSRQRCLWFTGTWLPKHPWFDESAPHHSENPTLPLHICYRVHWTMAMLSFESKKVQGRAARANCKALPSVKAVPTVTVPLDRKNGEKLKSQSLKICRPFLIRTL